jgi:hypothetical protein
MSPPFQAGSSIFIATFEERGYDSVLSRKVREATVKAERPAVYTATVSRSHVHCTRTQKFVTRHETEPG